MALVTTGSIPKALWPGVNAFFGHAYNEQPIQYKEIFDIHKSDKKFEEDVGLYGTGLATIKPEGQAIAYDEIGQGFRKVYEHDTYGLGFILTREHIEDNQYMEVAAARAKHLAFAMRQTLENVHAQVLNRAFNSSYTGADGLELCSAVHKLAKGGTYANELATAANLSESALEQALIDIRAFKNDAGLQIAVKGQKLIVPPELEFEACRILDSSLQNDTANNATNALRAKGRLAGGVCVNDYLTDTNAWFIKTDCEHGLKSYERRAPMMSPISDTDFDSENVKFKCTARFVASWTDPRGLFGSPGE